MPFQRQRSRVEATDRVSVRLNTRQRDLLIASPETPRKLGHLLHRAPVRDGKLSVRLTRGEIESLVAAAARAAPVERSVERELNGLLRYLESLEDRFVREGEGESGERGLRRTEIQMPSVALHDRPPSETPAARTGSNSPG